MLQKFKRLSLEQQMFLSFSGASVFLLLITLCLTFYIQLENQRQTIDTAISSAASYIASLDELIDVLERGYPDPNFSNHLDRLYQSYPELEIISVYNTAGLRFYHTSRRETGETVLNGEEAAILAGAEPYIASSYGTQGRQYTAFHAVKDHQGAVIGFVTVAMFSSAISQRNLHLVLIFLMILFVSVVTVLMMSRGIVRLLRDSLRGHQPAELLALYLQQGNVLNAIEDGLIATDPEGYIVFSNEQALQLFQESEHEMCGHALVTFFPTTRCIYVAKSGQGVHNLSCVIGDRQILLSEVPIVNNHTTEGVLNIFHDKTELRKLSDELSGTKYMLDTFRMFNHEFMNKLHVILGYLQTRQIQEAIQFITNSSLTSSDAIRKVADCVRVPRLCALIIGKMMYAAELGIMLSLSHDSSCREEDLLLSQEDLVTILGNLLENAIDELSKTPKEVREIELFFYCRPDCNVIVCSDTGRGIDPEVSAHIWEKGVSSKGTGRGIGLYLIGQLIEQYHGSVEVETELGEGTCFTITFTESEEIYEVSGDGNRR